MLISTICSISYPKTWGEIIQLEDQLQRPGRSRGRRPPRPPNSPGEGGWQKKMPTPMEFSRGKNGNIVKQLKKPAENRFYSIFLPGIMTQLKPHDMGPCLGIANQTNSSHLSMAGWSYPFKGALAIIFSGCSHCLASKSRKSFGQTQENQRRTPLVFRNRLQLTWLCSVLRSLRRPCSQARSFGIFAENRKGNDCLVRRVSRSLMKRGYIILIFHVESIS